MNQSDIMNFLKKEKNFLMKAYGVKSIGLFGSYAKNYDQTDSDIDILVELTEPRFELLAGLQVLYESLHKYFFLKDFQSSLWPGKKYAPAMPVYIETKTGKKIDLIRKQTQQRSYFLDLI